MIDLSPQKKKKKTKKKRFFLLFFVKIDIGFTHPIPLKHFLKMIKGI